MGAPRDGRMTHGVGGWAMHGVNDKRAIKSASLEWLDMSMWDASEPPPLEWVIHERVPREQVGLFSGIGGTGKTTIELMKNVAHVVGAPWYNTMPAVGPTLYVGTEDSDAVLRIRLTNVARYYNTTFKELTERGLHVLNLFGKDATIFFHKEKSGRVETTPLYRDLFQAAGDIKPINISLDPLARIFAGSEIDRGQVYGLVAHAQALAFVSGGSVTVLSHPSLQGISSGTGLSGSTAWHDAFRFRHYLRAPKEESGDEADSDLRELTFLKNQYGPKAGNMTLRYQRGLFLPETDQKSFEKLAADAAADHLFLDLLARFTRQGRNVSDKPTAPNYAPTSFAQEPEAKTARTTKAKLTDTMRRLFAADKIRIETYGRPSRLAQHIVAC
jgi:RecA-family ATPase